MDLTTQSARDILQRIGESPFDVSVWRRLMLLCLDQNDPETFKTLQVIVQGVEAMVAEKDRRGGQSMPQFLRNPTKAADAADDELHVVAFIGLSRNPKSADFLHRMGTIYLRELNLPKEAQKHFNRALFYEPTHKGAIEQMTEAAARLHAIQEPAAAIPEAATAAATHLGIAEVQRRKPRVAAIIKETGKLKIKTSGRNRQKPGEDIEADSGPEAIVSTQVLEGVRVMSLDLDKDPTSKAEEWLKQSNECLQGGNVAEAEEACSIAAGIDPKNIQLWGTWTMIGLAYYERQEFKNAIRAYQKASELRPELLESWFNLGIACQQAEQLTEALACYEKAREVNPEQPRNLSNLGSLYFQMGRYEEAETTLRRAVENKPDYARAWDNLASVLGAQEKLNEAMEACRQAISCKPDYFDPWYKLGFILFQNEDYHESGRALRRALSLQPDFAYAICYLAMIHARINELDRALLEGKRAASLNPQKDLLATMWNEIGLGYLNAEDVQNAESCYRWAVEANHEFWEAWFNLGYIHEVKFNYVDAIECYRQTLFLNPEFETAKSHLDGITQRLNG